MLIIEGTYKDGRIVLTEKPSDVTESKVLVTFLETKQIDLRERGISRQQAGDLRARLGAIAEDWNTPEMDIYDAD